MLLVVLSLFAHMASAEEIVINASKDSVYVYDDFDIVSSPISAENGTSGMGWIGSWQVPAVNGTVSVSSSSLNYPTAVGITATGGHAYSASISGQGVSRQLLNPVKLGEETTTFYVSFLTKKDATGNYRIDGLTATGAAAGFAVGVTPDGRLKVNAGNTAGWGAVTTQTDPGVIADDVTYFVVVRYHYENTQARVQISAFKEGDEIPVNDDAYTWDYEAIGGSLTTSVSSFRLAFPKGLGRIDEFRLGSTWVSVVSLDISEPELAIGSYRFPNFDWEDHPAQFANVASPLSYEIQIATDDKFSSVIDHDTTLLSRYVHDEPFDAGTYYWRRRSITYEGEMSEWQDTLSFTIEDPQEIITATVPGGQEDCTARIHATVAQAVASATSGNSVKLVFPAGDYYFGESLVGEVISLSGVKNIEVEGTGAIFHLSKRNQGLIEATACENVSVSGIKVTYAKSIFRVQGHVLSVNERTRSLTVSIQPESPGFDESVAPEHDIFILLHPSIDGRIKDGASTFYRKDSYVDHEDGTYTINLSEGGDFSDWELGDRFVYHFRSGSKHYVDFSESQNVTAYNLATDGWGSMGFVSKKGSNFNILNCKTEMQEGKWMMGNADGVHVREHVIGPWIEGLDMQATGDDGLAFYARCIAMTSVKPDGDQKAAVCVAEYFNLEKGDEVSFFQPTQGRILLETTVISVEELGSSYLVRFADELPDGMITGSPLIDVTQIWNRSKSCGEFMIRNSKFTNIRRYANVFRSKRGVVENNQYRGASSRAIYFRNETAYPNGLYASEIILRNNTIEDCSFDGAGTQAPIGFTFEGRGASVQSIGPRNILIEGQTIKDCPSPEIQLNGAANVLIRNNVVINSADEIENVKYTDNRSGDITYSGLLTPEADAHVQGGSNADSNFGTEMLLSCMEDVIEDNIRRSYLRFDLSSLSRLSVESVILRLRTASISGAGDMLSAYFVSDDNWEETAITWNNKPTKGALIEAVPNGLTPGEWIEFTVTNQVLNELKGDKKLSLVLYSGTNTHVAYDSREGAIKNRPQLVVALVKTTSPALHTIQATSGGNGIITPSGNVTVFSGNNVIFEFSADGGYEVNDVIVDGLSKGATDSYTINNVITDRTIQVIFSEIEGATTIEPEADAYVHGGTYENTNYGASENLILKTSDNLTYARKSYLRFDLSTIENTITSAKLRLKLEAINGGTTTHSVSFINDDNWGETTINWLNKPNDGEFLNSQNTPARDGWIEFDVTNQVEIEHGGDGKISLMLMDGTSSEMLSSYYSKEAGMENSPHLLIIAEGPLLVDEMDGNNTKINVYPNPATTHFTVHLSSITKADLKLFDLTGKMVMSKTNVSGQIMIPVNTLGNGIYILKVKTESGSYMQKILIIPEL